MEQQIDPRQFLKAVTQAVNIAELMDDRQLAEIAQEVIRDYKADKDSMADWLTRMEEGIKLASLAKGEKKTYPFESASNVKYPLVTTAALQFNARAYPAIVPEDTPVKAKVQGKDPDGAKAARAERIQSYMSWQLLTEMEEWDEQTDKLLTALPVVGDMFRKTWFNGERPESRLVEPGKFIVNNWVKTLATAPRCGEELEKFPFEVSEKEMTGEYREIDYDEDDDKQKPIPFLEWHCRLDLDEDGYPEPYIVTVALEREEIVRIVADFGLEDVALAASPMANEYGEHVGDRVSITKIKRGSYFTHYQFLPGFDGGLFGIGLGLLLGDISDAINTSFNMLIDAGHYASLGGGFIGSDFRIKGGAQRMRPGEWRKVSAKGIEIKGAMVPATYPGPDATMFQMLGMLIDAGKEVASVKDVLTGETATNMQPTTVMALIEQGLKVFTAAYKRIFRALKKEFSLLARINAATVSPEKYQTFLDEPADPRHDFGALDNDVQPVADPQSVTKMQEMAKAQLVMEMAQNGLADPVEASSRILEAASIPEREALAPKQDPQAAQMQALMMDIQAQAAMADLAQKRADVELTIAKIDSEQVKAFKDVADAENNERRLEMDRLKAVLEEVGREMDRTLAGRPGLMAG